MEPRDGTTGRRIDQPKPGFFKVRLRRAGPWVPAQIREDPPLDPWTGEILDRSTHLQAFIEERPVEIEQVWLWGRIITQDEWKWLKALQAIRRQ